MSDQQQVEPVQATPKTQRKRALKADDYQKLTLKEQIYRIPDTYIGSDEQNKHEEWVFRFSQNKLEKRDIVVSQAVERLYLEILSNAGDNSFTSREAGVDPGMIDIILSETMISIKNGGNPIPIEINTKENMYVPELIFGNLLSSSNYDTSVIRMGCGRNGYGAKLVNIFSKIFQIDIGDSIRKLRYRQEWRDNMSVKDEPVIDEYHGENYVKVSYLLDFERFGYKDQKYPPEVFALFGRLAMEMSMTCKVPLRINGNDYTCSNIKDFASFVFTQEAVKKSIVYTYHNEPVFVELCVLDTPDSGEVLSYVNGMITRDGGVHVQSVLKEISSPLLDLINNGKASKNNKDKNDKKQIQLKIEDVRPHISLILNCRLPDPKFTSQTKTQLSSPKIKFEIPNKILEPIHKWDLVSRLYAALEAKQFKSLQKTDGKKKRHIPQLKGEDANNAGTNQSEECTLYIVEGKSAMGYAVKAISSIPNGRDFHGILPIKGKLLNVMNASAQQIAENEELIEIKKMVGLRENVDYTSKENFSTLRYGYVVILTDADDDGKHITGLILNFFFCRFPSLLARGYLFFLRTPILRAKLGSDTQKFFNYKDYENWQNQTPNWKSYKHRYYKGLGTSKDEDVLDDFKEPKIVACVYDDRTEDSLKLAFDNKLSNRRKDWIAKWKNEFNIGDINMCPISTFIEMEFIQFSVSNLHRSIPKFMDGLKISQRKVLWAAFLHWSSSKNSGLVKNPKELKVARFAAMAAEKTNYHHGELCLAETIISMAQDFVGSNNLPYFTQDGQFGTRNLGGEDAAQPRYPDTRPQQWLRYVFRMEDFPLMEFMKDEGQDVEPKHFLPIIPMCLVNGCMGIGTGHSTFIPNCSPIDIIDWYLSKLKSKEVDEIIPWYRGFKGEIEIRKTIVTQDPDFDEIEPGQEPLKSKRQQLSMVSKGIYSVGKKFGQCIVKEIPIGIWIDKYRKYLEGLREGKVITDVRNLSNHNTPLFEISGLINPSVERLKLSRAYGLTNMVLLDANNNPNKYSSINDILENFYEQRLPYYKKRKEYQLGNLEQNINTLKTKFKFLTLLSNETIVITKRKKQDIIEDMKKHNIPEELLSNIRISSLSEEELTELQKQIDESDTEKQKLEKTNIQDLWISDLEEFKNKYIEIFGIDRKDE